MRAIASATSRSTASALASLAQIMAQSDVNRSCFASCWFMIAIRHAGASLYFTPGYKAKDCFRPCCMCVLVQGMEPERAIMDTSSPAPRPPVVVKKYANRRLYNTETSSYITLDNLAEMIRTGRDFVVYDAKSSEDITRGVLTQIIVEEESKGTSMLPTAFLRQLVGFYGGSLQGVVPQYLETAMSTFAQQQAQLRDAVQQTFKPFLPASVNEMSRQNMAMIERALSLFNPFHRGSAPLPPAPEAMAEPSAEAIVHNSLAQQAPQTDELQRLRLEIDNLRVQLAVARAEALAVPARPAVPPAAAPATISAGPAPSMAIKPPSAPVPHAAAPAIGSAGPAPIVVSKLPSAPVPQIAVPAIGSAGPAPIVVSKLPSAAVPQAAALATVPAVPGPSTASRPSTLTNKPPTVPVSQKPVLARPAPALGSKPTSKGVPPANILADPVPAKPGTLPGKPVVQNSNPPKRGPGRGPAR